MTCHALSQDSHYSNLTRSSIITSHISLDFPYGLTGTVGESSRQIPIRGMPWTAALEGKMKCLTSFATAHGKRVAVRRCCCDSTYRG